MIGQEIMDFEDRMEAIREEIHSKYPGDWPEPVMEPIYYGRLKKTMVEGKKAILDANSGIVWDVVSDQYALIPHEKTLYDLLVGLPEEMGKPEVELSFWKDGGRFSANILFPEIDDRQSIEIRKGDLVRPRLKVKSSYDRAVLHGVEMGAEQVVCSNGLVVFKAESKTARKHIAGSRVTPEAIAKLAENFIEEYSISTERWRKWAEKQLSMTEVDMIMEALPFSEKERDSILHLPLMSRDNKILKEINPTFWDINSAATQFAKHEVRGEQRSSDLEFDIALIMENTFRLV